MNRTHYSPKECAEMLGVSSRTIIRWCDTGKLEHVRLPGKKTIRKISVKAWNAFMDSNTVGTVDEVKPERVPLKARIKKRYFQD